MAVSHLHRTIQDEQNGELLIGAQVTLCSPGTQTPISAAIFADVGLTQQLSNPFTSGDGFIDVYTADPITVLVKTAYGAAVTLADYIPVLPLAENLFTSPTPLTINNSPGTHLFLSGTDSSNIEWVDLDDIYSPTDDNLLGWFVQSSFVLNNVVRDDNGAVLTADVGWPDGNTGVYTADTVSGDFPGRVDAWHVNWSGGTDGRTYFQPAVTRDANGAVVTTPTPVVVDGITDVMP